MTDNVYTEDMLVEDLRKSKLREINNNSAERAELEARHGEVFNLVQLSEQFEIRGFMAPYAVVRRLRDGVVGSFEFQHQPRYYFNFEADH